MEVGLPVLGLRGADGHGRVSGHREVKGSEFGSKAVAGCSLLQR